eukprot:TRINITY_DN9790_c0_g3_i1.p1 TRINITY_DN9790_c0_g3~~TRINITY_DN9790_c0_g3_i1.p1  ORF type:complete len:873 (+),score=189.21 TRINITY_DN9790_c0_g3_i1:351-2621(+)
MTRMDITNEGIVVVMPKYLDLTQEPIFGDEDTRSFYQDLPALRELVPEVLFGEKKDPPSPSTNATSPSENNAAAQPCNPTEKTAGSPKKVKEGKKTGKDDAEKSDTDHSDSEEPSTKSAGGVSLDELISRLPNCVNREMIDKAALDFCYLNSKGARKRLVNFVFNVPRTSLNLLPYYSRLIATLDQCMNVGKRLVAKLEKEFETLFVRKDQINIEIKIKNIKFLGELTKFRVTPTSRTFSCLNLCLDDFVYHNVEVACALLETCGRFLYRTPETHVRAKNMLEKMMRIKKFKNLDNRLDNLTENAYYQCIPPERGVQQQKIYTPLEQYVRKLIFTDLSKPTAKSVLKRLTKIPQDQEDVLLRNLLKVHRVKYENVEHVASIVGGLNEQNNALCIKIVDILLERIHQNHEENDWTMNQRRIMQIKFLGELYNYSMIEKSLIFQQLYDLISCTDPMQDPIDDCFRVKMVCVLLDVCGKFFNRGSSKRKLDRFLVYFQRYFLAKSFASLEVQYMVTDCLAKLRPNLVRFSSFAVANAQVRELERKAASAAPSSPQPLPHTNAGESKVAKTVAKQKVMRTLTPEEQLAKRAREAEEARKREEQDFEREFAKMVRDSIDQRKLEARTPSGLSVAPTTATVKRSPGGAFLQSNKTPAPEDGAMRFRVLFKRGGKAKETPIDIPLENELARNRSLQQEAEKKERLKIKKKTLAAYDETQREEFNQLTYGNSNVPVYHLQGQARMNQRARRQYQRGYNNRRRDT